MTVVILDGLVKKASQQFLRFAEVFGMNAVADARSVNVALDQATLLERLQVLGNGRLGEGQFIHNIPANTGTALGQVAQNGYPGRMSQPFGKLRDLLILVLEDGCFVNGHNVSFYIANIR
jgi:hypothetical protein